MIIMKATTNGSPFTTHTSHSSRRVWHETLSNGRPRLYGNYGNALRAVEDGIRRQTIAFQDIFVLAAIVR